MGTSDSTLSFRQISNSTSYLRLEKVTTTVRGLASAGRMAITSRRARSAGRRAGLIADLGVHSFIYCYRRMCTMSRLTLEARELGVSYGEEVVFSNESFRLEGPGLVVVMGPNGAGKTTLFRALLGLIPVRGRVLVNGEDVTGRPERAGRLIGYVPQWRGEDYHFPVSVREVVESAIALRRRPPRFSIPEGERSRVSSVLERVGIGEIANRPLSELSGGQRQRVFIARALVWDPPILIMDEPLTAVDPMGRVDLVRMIKEMASSRLVLVSSHDPSMFLDRARLIMVVNRGVVALGPPDEVIREDLLSRVYGRSVFIVEKCVHVVDGYAV